MDSFVNNIKFHIEASFLFAILASYLGGLLASLTPCVYPLIPVTAGIVGKNNLGGSKIRGLFISIVYVSGIAVTFAGLGLFAASTGRLFGEINTNPYTLLIIGNIIIFFGLSMLGLFSFPVISTRTSTSTGSIAGIFILGIASGFAAGPCTTPVVGVLLAYIATTHKIINGGILMFVFAFGMGTTLIIIGTFAGIISSLPRSGVWMEMVKKGLGIIMIGLGEYFLIKAGQVYI
jgi:thiol:disulfide interchange protein DsbD